MYCDYNDVNANVQGLVISYTSIPPIDTVQTFCQDITDILDLRMAAVGITPTSIVDIKILGYLKSIAVNGVIGKIYLALNMFINAEIYNKAFEAAIIGIERNPKIVQPTESRYAAPSGSKAGTRPFQRDVRSW